MGRLAKPAPKQSEGGTAGLQPRPLGLTRHCLRHRLRHCLRHRLRHCSSPLAFRDVNCSATRGPERADRCSGVISRSTLELRVACSSQKCSCEPCWLTGSPGKLRAPTSPARFPSPKPRPARPGRPDCDNLEPGTCAETIYRVSMPGWHVPELATRKAVPPGKRSVKTAHFLARRSRNQK